MGFVSKVKALLNNNQNQPQIIIRSRSDGLTKAGLPSYIEQNINNYPKTLRCGDRTELPFKTSNTLISGKSVNRDEILYGQIAAAMRNGYTPVVLSSKGKEGEIYRVLRTIYYESDISFIANNSSSDYYLPFSGMEQSRIADFFYSLTTTINLNAAANGMLIKKYIDVCVKVFCVSSEALAHLIEGRIDHMGLLNEIDLLRTNNRITAQEEVAMRNSIESAQAVSVTVLSIFYDFMYKMRFSFSAKPLKFPFNCSKIINKMCIYMQIENVSGLQNNAPYAQCYQWYLSKVIESEFQANSLLPSQKILLIIDNLSGNQLRWFSWMCDLQNTILLMNYDDYYSLLTDYNDLRESFAGKMDRVFMFSHINSNSAEWCSRFIGVHSVIKRSTTKHPPKNWVEVFISPAPDVTETEVDEAWFKKEDIQRLGNAGIVYCKDMVFRNGNNFCKFQFKN